MIGPGWLFEELAKFELLPFAIFIALAEVIIGYLLLIRRYSTLGAVMLFPMISNILIIVMSLHWQGTPVIDGIFLGMNIHLLYMDRDKLFPLLGISSAKEFTFILEKTAVYHLGLVCILAGTLIAYFTKNEEFRYLTRLGFLTIVGFAGFQFYRAKKKGPKLNMYKLVGFKLLEVNPPFIFLPEIKSLKFCAYMKSILPNSQKQLSLINIIQ